MNQKRIEELTNKIHGALVELCAIADQEDKLLDVYAKTYYLNRAGKVGGNAIMNCSVNLLEK